MQCLILLFFFFVSSSDHRDLQLLKHPSPTRPSSDLITFDRDLILPQCFVKKVIDVMYARAGTARDLACFGAGARIAWQRYRRCLSRRCSRSEEHTSELQSLMRISYAVFCLKKQKTKYTSEYHIKKLQTRNHST